MNYSILNANDKMTVHKCIKYALTKHKTNKGIKIEDVNFMPKQNRDKMIGKQNFSTDIISLIIQTKLLHSILLDAIF